MNKKTYGDRSEALERFLDELIQDPDTPAPLTGELDTGTVRWARRIVALKQSRKPSPAEESAALAHIWTRVLEGSRAASAANGYSLEGKAPRQFGFGLPRMALAAAGLVIAVAIGLYVWVGQAPAVSAQEIIDKARATANSPAAGGVQSYIVSSISVSKPEKGIVAGLIGNERFVNERRQWYQAPNFWSGESVGGLVDAAGKAVPGRDWHVISVSDGIDLWNYDAVQNTVVINRAPSDPSGPGNLAPFGQVSDLNNPFDLASVCLDAKVTGDATIAGRPTFVIDLGPSKCPSASAPAANGRLLIWVDKVSFFVLKQVQYGTAKDEIVASREVTEIQYNVPIDLAQFTFTPPAGATVVDNRPKPAPGSDQFEQQLEQIAKQVDFPVLAPSYLPSGLAPKQPKIDAMMDNSVEISYLPANEPEKDSMASMMKGLTIREVRATNSLVARWTDRADPMSIGGNKGWLRRGMTSQGGGGSDSAALVLRDGALISISSFTIAPEELVKVAASLQPVAGSKPSLPNPMPPTLAELRSKVGYPIFVPTFVPAGLVPVQATGGERPGENVTIKYHDASGAVALTLTNGTLDCCPGLAMIEVNVKTEHVKLANGIPAKLAIMNANAGGLYLWFEQDKRLISVNSPVLTRDQMLQVAASLSKTADLGKAVEPPARPTPTPVPPPPFKILRPNWLPEPMQVTEEYEPGSVVMLYFDPRPNDAPHSMLTLSEMPKTLVVPGGYPDPQETHQPMGGHEVTIIKRGKDCITLSWNAGDLQLILTNPYDPPGHPRYTCEQLKKIVESTGSTSTP